jgi:hypothetical protein
MFATKSSPCILRAVGSRNKRSIALKGTSLDDIGWKRNRADGVGDQWRQLAHMLVHA